MRTRYLLASLLLIPLVDALVLVAIVGWGLLTWLQTVALVVLTGLLGMLLVRAEGRTTLARFQRKLAAGSPPTDELLDGGLLIAAGAFLLTPGLVTDLIGLLFALPLTRYPIRTALKRWVVVPYIDAQTGGFASGVVWTSGFPNSEGAGGDPFAGGFDVGSDVGGNDPAGTDAADAGGGSNGGGSSSTGSSTRSSGAAADDDIVDVDFERTDDDSRSTESSNS
jgi:UPF0716 protein FxsA